MTSERRRALHVFLLLSAIGCQSKPEEQATSPEPSAAPSTPVAATTASEQPTSEVAPPSASASAIASASASAAPAVTATSTAASTTSKTKQAAAAAVSATAAAYTGDDPCTHKTLHTAQVRNACHTGGRRAAKTLMKNMVAKAKAAGENIKCSSCHVDLKKFELKDNALDDLKKWL